MTDLRRRGVTLTIGSVSFDDPYAWMEDDSPEVVEWQHRENAEVGRSLRGLPFFERLRETLERGTAATRVWAPRHHGPHWFRLEAAGADSPVRLAVSDTASGAGRVLVDPERLGGTTPPTIDWFWPSPDGRLVAVGISEAGSEQSVLHLVRTEDGEFLGETIPDTFLSTVAWLPDSSGFYYSGFPGPERGAARCYFHRVGETPRRRPEPVPNEEVWLTPQVSKDGRWVAVYMGRRGRPAYIEDRAGSGWRTFLPPSDGSYQGAFGGDELLCITTDGSPRGRVVGIPLAGPEDRSGWREVVPASGAVLMQIAVVGDRIVIGEMVDARARIRLFGLDGRPDGEVPLPGAGAIGMDARTSSGSPMFFAGADELLFVYHSMTASPAVHRFDMKTRTLQRLTEPALEHPDLVSRLVWAESADGTRIPIEVMHRRDLDLSRAHAALIHAYGGFSYALLPAYFPHFAAFAEAGGVVAIPHCRGGLEYGQEWWDGGRLLTKKHTFEDLYAAAERLVADGLTEKGRIAFTGASNGGVLALVAANQRPDLWGCVVSLVPLSDLMRAARDGREPWTGRVSKVEYGDPEDPTEGPYLLSWSPYHNVREGTPYPGVLVVSGESDVRCPVWHARKWVERARAASTSGNPILLRTWPAMGHGTGLTTRRQSEWLAEWMGFIFDRLGVAPVRS